MRLHYNTEHEKKQVLFEVKNKICQKLKNIENKEGKIEKVANKIVVHNVLKENFGRRTLKNGNHRC